MRRSSGSISAFRFFASRAQPSSSSAIVTQGRANSPRFRLPAQDFREGRTKPHVHAHLVQGLHRFVDGRHRITSIFLAHLVLTSTNSPCLTSSASCFSVRTKMCFAASSNSFSSSARMLAIALFAGVFDGKRVARAATSAVRATCLRGLGNRASVTPISGTSRREAA